METVSYSGGIQIQIPPSQYHALQDAVGLTGSYDGHIHNNGTIANAHLSLRDANGSINGELYIPQSTLKFDGGFLCGDMTVPITTFPVHMTSSGPSCPSQLTTHSTFTASGSTTREEPMLGSFSGQAVTSFQVTLYNTTPRFDPWLFGTIAIDAPNPCRDQTLNVYFERRNTDLFKGFGYRPLR